MTIEEAWRLVIKFETAVEIHCVATSHMSESHFSDKSREGWKIGSIAKEKAGSDLVRALAGEKV